MNIQQLQDFVYIKHTPAASTWELADVARTRHHLLIPYRGVNFRVKFVRVPSQIPSPLSLATAGTLIDSNFKGYFFDKNNVPSGQIWVFCATASTQIDIEQAFTHEIHD